MLIPTFDSNNNEDACISYQTQVKMFGRRHGFERVFTGEQADVDTIIVDGVNMWCLRNRFEHKIIQENIKA